MVFKNIYILSPIRFKEPVLPPVIRDRTDLQDHSSLNNVANAFLFIEPAWATPAAAVFVNIDALVNSASSCAWPFSSQSHTQHRRDKGNGNARSLNPRSHLYLGQQWGHNTYNFQHHMFHVRALSGRHEKGFFSTQFCFWTRTPRLLWWRYSCLRRGRRGRGMTTNMFVC